MAKISALTTAKALRGQSRAWCQLKHDHICVSKDGGWTKFPVAGFSFSLQSSLLSYAQENVK